MSDDIPHATEAADISGHTVRLGCLLGRDMMPGVNMDRRISVVVRLEAHGRGSPEGAAVIDEVWLKAGGKVAHRKLERWGALDGWPFGTRDGPDWDDRSVDVVAHVRDSRGGDHYLLARDQAVGYCW